MSAAFARSVILPSSTLQEGRFFVCAACFFSHFSAPKMVLQVALDGGVLLRLNIFLPPPVHCVKVLIEKVYVPFRHLTGSGEGMSYALCLV